MIQNKKGEPHPVFLILFKLWLFPFGQPWRQVNTWVGQFRMKGGSKNLAVFVSLEAISYW